jgi:hypothetical protein
MAEDASQLALVLGHVSGYGISIYIREASSSRIAAEGHGDSWREAIDDAAKPLGLVNRFVNRTSECVDA